MIHAIVDIDVTIAMHSFPFELAFGSSAVTTTTAGIYLISIRMATKSKRYKSVLHSFYYDVAVRILFSNNIVTATGVGGPSNSTV